MARTDARSLRSYVLQDWAANSGNVKAQLILAMFRLAQRLRGPKSHPIRFWVVPYLVTYRVLVEWVLGIEMPWNTRIGAGLRLFHGPALVINDGSVIGDGCTLRHSTTIGNKRAEDGSGSSPVLGDRVDVGAHVVILGPVTIGDDVIVAAGSVVTRDVPGGATVAGNPARVVQQS
jgi:serine acetyltransferase